MEKTKAKITAKALPLLLISVACWLIIIIALLFTILRSTLNEEDRLRAFYEQYGIELKTGIPADDATRAFMQLIHYMNGDAEGIQLTVSEYGRQVEAYNQQEIDHMADVRVLYQSFRTCQTLTPFALIILIVSALAARRLGTRRMLLRSYYTAFLLVIAVTVGCLAWAALDFTSFWTGFHHVFFTNDLWLMDYATCRMIRICPEGLFADISLRLALRSILALGGTTLLFAMLQGTSRRIEKARAKKE